MRRIIAFVGLALLVTGCREVRVNEYAQGTSAIIGPPQVLIVRNQRDLEAVGIRAAGVRFNHEFGLVLLMGAHRESGWRQVVESIRANTERVRIVAFERGPAEGGQATPEYRTYTLWIVPNTVYRRGSVIDVVNPAGEQITSTIAR